MKCFSHSVWQKKSFFLQWNFRLLKKNQNKTKQTSEVLKSQTVAEAKLMHANTTDELGDYCRTTMIERIAEAAVALLEC